MRFANVVSLALLCVWTSSLFARPVRVWTDEELWKDADVVVIGSAVTSKDAEGKRGGEPAPDWIEVETVFAVAKSLKGKNAEKSVSVEHYRYHDAGAEVSVVDGPSFVRFDSGKKHTYLMFLKLDRETKRLEPLTGQYDPWGSFFRLERYQISAEK